MGERGVSTPDSTFKQRWLTAPALAYDTETTGLDYHRGDRMFSYALCSDQQKFQVCRLDRKETLKEHTTALRSLWTGDGLKIPKVMHNAKFDLRFTENFLQRELDGNIIHDTYVQSKLLLTDHYSHALDDLAWDLCGYSKAADKAIKPYLVGGKGFEKVPERLMDTYQRADVDRTMTLHLFFWPKIQADPLLLEIYDFEMRLIWTTMRIEQRGVLVNRTQCRMLIEELKGKEDAVLKELRAVTWPNFRPSCADQVAHLLYDELKYPVLKKTSTGKRSVKKEVLAALKELRDDPRIGLIQAFRSWQRGQSVVASYLDLADRFGVLRPKINTVGAQTGRESCSEPNLQNVEKEGVLLNPYPIPARRCFRPRAGEVNFHVDYKGIEMRILIQYSGEDCMIERLRTKVPNDDVHEIAAILFYGKRYSECKDPKVKKTLRNASKNANFAIPYGAGWKKVMATLGLHGKDGREAFDRYTENLPKLARLSKDVVQEIKDTGYATTLFGRKIYVPKNEAFIGMNYKTQGTAAEICKRAQVYLHEWLPHSEFKDVHIILPIHDEIVLGVPYHLLNPETLRRLMLGIRERMIYCPQMVVPLEIEIDYTIRSWSEKKPYKLEIP
jgi:DNA polymerase-1